MNCKKEFFHNENNRFFATVFPELCSFLFSRWTEIVCGVNFANLGLGDHSLQAIWQVTGAKCKIPAGQDINFIHRQRKMKPIQASNYRGARSGKKQN